MEKKFYQTEAFKKLQAKWERRLAEEGLIDAETAVGENRVLKQNASNVYRQLDKDSREAKEIYFRQLGEFIYQTQFENFVEFTVMHLRSQGAKIIEICEILEKWGCRRYRRTVRLIIRKYESIWGIRKWKPEQLKYRWKPKQPIR